mmetsp:Transcript_21576/g.59971  ORF Transcript_21576/g.59971 Transcript_21576/m.59971 type:complete len:496 (-) Transcript_21576:852-2339(-)
MRPLRIASLNAYLICDVFNNYRQTHPEKRASKIRSAFLGPSSPELASELALELASASASSDESVANKTIHAKTGGTASRLAPDLCFFQEVWGSGIWELTRGIEHSIPPRRSSSRLASGFLWLAKSCSSNGSGNGNCNGSGSGDSSGDSSNDSGNARWGAAASLSFRFSRLGELVDTLRFHWQRTGGLYDASRPSLSCLYRRKHTFGVSRSRSHKGVEATLWDVPQWNERPERSDTDNATGGTAECTSTSASTSTSHRRQLLVFNTHLDPWHPSNRKQQIAEIAGFMEETLRSIEDGAVTGDSCSVNDRRSPSLLSSWCFELLFPCTNQGGDPQQRSGYDWSQTAVLVVGDFNIKAGSDEYRGMFSRPCRDWIDCFASDGESDDGDHHHHPEKHTYAVRNSLVEYPEDCGRIDYILGIPSLVDDDRNDGEGDDRTTQNGVDCDCARRSRSGGERQGPPRSRVFLPLTVVSRWIRTEPIGEESSDHYALIVELIPSA